MKNISKMPMMAWGCVGTWPALSETEKIMMKPAIASNAAVIWGVKEEEKEEWGKIKDTGYIPASTSTTVVNFTFQTDNT